MKKLLLASLFAAAMLNSCGEKKSNHEPVTPNKSKDSKPKTSFGLLGRVSKNELIQARRYYGVSVDSEKIVIWGGIGESGKIFDDGTIFTLKSYKWKEIAISGAPQARSHHSVTSLMNKVYIWGGQVYVPSSDTTEVVNDGYSYDPTIQKWDQINSVQAPPARKNHFAFSTPEGLLIWGGARDGQKLSDGAIYDPDHNEWLAMNTVAAPAENPVFQNAVYLDGIVYTLSTTKDSAEFHGFNTKNNVWKKLSIDEQMVGVQEISMAAGDGVVFLWGGRSINTETPEYSNRGFSYDIKAASWTPSSEKNAPAGRTLNSLTFADDRFIVWGGIGTKEYTNFYAFDFKNNLWLKDDTVILKRHSHIAAWRNRKLTVWGGLSNGKAIGSGQSFSFKK